MCLYLPDQDITVDEGVRGQGGRSSEVVPRACLCEHLGYYLNTRRLKYTQLTG